MIAGADAELLAALLAGLDPDPLADHALLHFRQEVAHDAEVDVGLQEGRAHVGEGVRDVGVRELDHAPEAVPRAAESLGQGLEHGAAG